MPFRGIRVLANALGCAGSRFNGKSDISKGELEFSAAKIVHTRKAVVGDTKQRETSWYRLRQERRAQGDSE